MKKTIRGICIQIDELSILVMCFPRYQPENLRNIIFKEMKIARLGSPTNDRQNKLSCFFDESANKVALNGHSIFRKKLSLET